MSAYDVETATKYTLKDDDIERAQLLVNQKVGNTNREAFTQASPDAIRLFARSIGDDNPLYCDEEYGPTTHWGTQIGPGIMARNINTPLRADPLPEEIRSRTRSLFKGIHQFQSNSEWEYFKPIVPGERLFSYSYVEDVTEKVSSFGGKTVLVTRVEVKFNSDAEIVSRRRWIMIHSERKAAASRGKYAGVEFTPQTEEDLAELDAVYASEHRRGAEPRFWEDVAVDEPLAKMAKGPLTVTEVIMFHAGGFGLDPFLSASRIAYQNRLRFPAFYINNSEGVPEVGQRVHWDSEWARAIGNPRAYDYGFMRECWLYHFLSDWSGDDGIVLHQHARLHRFNYMGDVTMFSGKVLNKTQTPDGRGVVEVSINAVNQRGEETVIGGGTLGLPAKGTGALTLPEAPADLRDDAANLLERHETLKREAR